MFTPKMPLDSTDLIMPKVDYAFKRIFGESQLIFVTFINNVLRGPHKVQSVTFTNTEMTKNHKSDKSSRLDVRARLDNDAEINIEIQLAGSVEYKQRMLYYWSKIYEEQLEIGVGYDQLKPAIGVHILDFVLFPETPKVRRHFEIMEVDDKTSFSDLLQIYTFELPKVPDVCYTELEKWLLFIKDPLAAAQKGFIMEQPALQEAYTKLEFLSHDKQTRAEYDARLKEIRDQESIARTRLNEGLMLGEIKGKQEEKLAMAKKMKLARKSISEIMEFTELSSLEIEAL